MPRFPIVQLVLTMILTVAATVSAQTGELKDIGVQANIGTASLATRRAVVIGVDEYEDSGIPGLHYCEKDARDMAKALESAGWKVTLVTMAQAPRPTTRDAVLAQVGKVCRRAKPYDTVLVYFSGHGFADAKENNYLCAWNTEKAKLELTAVPVSDVINRLENSGAKKRLLVLDACRNLPGKMVDASGFSRKQLKASKGLGLLFGTAPGERSLEPLSGLKDHHQRPINNGLLTHFVLQGLAGEAKLNGDRFITFRELSYWVGREMEAFCKKRKDIDQVPYFRWVGGANHDVLLCELRGEVPVRPKFSGLQFLCKNAQGFDEYRAEKSGLTLVLIPGGIFSMGSEEGDNDEKPVRRVTLSAYFLSKFEVTNGQWKTFCDATRRSFPEDPDWDLKNYFATNSEHPVVNVSHPDCEEYCTWAGLRLPTEAQWEFAARGATGRKYPWGNAAPSKRTARFGKIPEDSPRRVGSFSEGVGPFGLQDQAGNVFEWCCDAYKESYQGLEAHDPEASSTGFLRVMRGGGFNYPAKWLRSANRVGFPRNRRLRYIGFRPARVATK